MTKGMDLKYGRKLQQNRKEISEMEKKSFYTTPGDPQTIILI